MRRLGRCLCFQWDVAGTHDEVSLMLDVLAELFLEKFLHSVALSSSGFEQRASRRKGSLFLSVGFTIRVSFERLPGVSDSEMFEVFGSLTRRVVDSPLCLMNASVRRISRSEAKAIVAGVSDAELIGFVSEYLRRKQE